jgi:aspartate kinase
MMEAQGMRILVQKFGGTSLSTEQARERVIGHIERERNSGYAVVVVVSAMGRKGDPYATDTLLSLIRDNGDALPAREKDMLLACGEIISATAMCSLLQARGIPAAALTGGGAGFLTDDQFGSEQTGCFDICRAVKLLS